MESPLESKRHSRYFLPLIAAVFFLVVGVHGQEVSLEFDGFMAAQPPGSTVVTTEFAAFGIRFDELSVIDVSSNPFYDQVSSYTPPNLGAVGGGCTCAPSLTVTFEFPGGEPRTVDRLRFRAIDSETATTALTVRAFDLSDALVFEESYFAPPDFAIEVDIQTAEIHSVVILDGGDGVTVEGFVFDAIDCDSDGIADGLQLTPDTDSNGDLVLDSCQINPYRRADLNGDGVVDVADAITHLNHLFQGDPLECRASGDVNDDSALDIADVIALLGFLFEGSFDIPEPFVTCGLDPSGPLIDCRLTPCP